MKQSTVSRLCAMPLALDTPHGQNASGGGLNVDAAKALLEQAGLSDGFDLEMALFATNREQAAVIMQASLQMVGINMTISNQERGAFYDNTAQGQHEMMLGGLISGDSVDLAPQYHSQSPGDAGNRAFLRDLQVDEYLRLAKIAPDPVKRREVCAEMYSYMMDNAYTLPLYTKRERIAYRADLVGLQISKSAQHLYDQLHFE